jgi:hypothetical protein
MVDILQPSTFCTDRRIEVISLSKGKALSLSTCSYSIGYAAKNRSLPRYLSKTYLSMRQHQIITQASISSLEHYEILQDVRKVWNQCEFYLLFIIYIIWSICSPRHYAFSQSLYHVCVVLLNILGATVAQLSVIRDVWH